MDIEDIRPDSEALVEVPWGDPYTLVRARIVAVRRNANAGPGGFSPRPVTVEWLEPPPFPKGLYPKYSTVDADKIRPADARRRRGMATLELFA